MTIIDLKAQLKNDGLLTAHVGINIKKFIVGENVFKNNKWNNAIDVFGIYQGKDGRYCFFITDSEKGIPEYSAVFATESEACDALIKKISRSERIYQKSKN